LRVKENPYTGFFNCAKLIAHEEGIGSLFHGWWIIFFVLVYGSQK
jgi:hypothetical protein